MNQPPRVALATCARLPELDDDDRPLREALAARGIPHRCLVWDDPSAPWDEADLVLIRSTWDYWDGPGRREAFVAWAERVATRAPLWNGPEVIRDNTHKSYLRSLEAAGVPVIPTIWLSPGERADGLAQRIVARGWSEVVIKPAVSAGAMGAKRLDARTCSGEAEAHAAELAQKGEVMVQRYLRSIESEGELSVVFFGGEASHAIRKVPAPGDFRSQPEYESRVTPAPIDADALDVARAAFAAVGRPLLYARVDLVRADDGALNLIELELTEPSLYFRWSEGSAARFVEVIARQIEAR
jgi:glutathione synthase/RimK-type ligase-like ATP-grasp enzyme